MPPKLRHECERCGLVAEIERAGRYRDEDYLELFRAHMELDQAMRGVQALRHNAEARLKAALLKIADLEALVPEPEAEKLPF